MSATTEQKAAINVTSIETGRSSSKVLNDIGVNAVLSTLDQQALAMGRLVLYYLAMEKTLDRTPAIVEGGMGIFEGTDTAFLATEDAIMLTCDAFSGISFIAEDGTEHGTACTSYSEALKVMGC